MDVDAQDPEFSQDPTMSMQQGFVGGGTAEQLQHGMPQGGWVNFCVCACVCACVD